MIDALLIILRYAEVASKITQCIQIILAKKLKVKDVLLVNIAPNALKLILVFVLNAELGLPLLNQMAFANVQPKISKSIQMTLA